MRLRRSVSASSGTSTWNGRMALPVSCATAVMAGWSPLCAQWPRFAALAGLAERQGVGLHAGVEEGDLERALGDRALLADELVQPRLGHRAGALVVDVVPVVGARRQSVDAHAELH